MERGWNRIICGEVCARAHLVAQSCPTLYDPRDCSLPGSSICGILQARILEWLAKPFSRESSQPRDRTQVSRTVGRFFTGWATREARVVKQMQPNVIVKPRLQVCGIHHAFFQKNILKMENRETQEKDLPYLAMTMSCEDMMLRVAAHRGIMSEKQENHRDTNPEIWHCWVTMRDWTMSSPNS